MTAFTTLPFCTCPSGAASFTLAVITSPRPARRPVEPPSGRIICSLRAPELSATSSIDLIITAMFVSSYLRNETLMNYPVLLCDPRGSSLSRAPRVSLAPGLLRGNAQTSVDVNFRYQRRLPHNVFQRPAFQFRQRPRLFDLHHVARMRFVLLVVRVELLPDRDHPLVHRMRLLARHLDHNRLLHLVRDDSADQFLMVRLACFRLACSFRHYRFSALLVVVLPVAAVLTTVLPVSVFGAASSCSRRTVWTRAISRRSPRIFFKLSVCPIFIWNFSLKSWSAKSFSWCLSSTSVKLRIFSAFIKSDLSSQLPDLKPEPARFL